MTNKLNKITNKIIPKSKGDFTITNDRNIY